MTHPATARLRQVARWITLRTVAMLLLATPLAHAGAPTKPDAAGVALSAQELAWRQQHPVIRVGVYAGDHMPAETWVAGRPEGMAVDYVRLLAGRVGLRIEFRPYNDWVAVNFPKPGQALPYDLLTALPVRAGTGYDYLKPFSRAHIVLVARKGDPQIRTERDLGDVRIAVDRANRDLIAALQKQYGGARLVYANSNRDALDLVAQRQADAYVGISEANTRGLLLQRDRDDLSLLGRVASILPVRDVAPALPNRNPMLLQLLRKAEASVTGVELERLGQRWGVDELAPGTASSAALLSPQERQWLRTLRPLRVGYEVDRAPYTFVNAQGKFDGLAADYLELIRKSLGVRIELVPADDWNSLQRMVRAREVDLVAAAMPEDFSAQDMLFSRPYEHFPEVIVTRQQGRSVAGPEDLAGRVVAAREEAGLLPRLRVLLPNSRIVPVGSNETGLDMVADSRADAYIGTLPAIDALVRDRYAAQLRVSGPAGVDQDFTVAVSTEQARLLPLIDRVLRGVGDEQRQRIRSRWLTTEYRFGVPWLWVLVGLGVAALVLLIVAAAYTRSRRALEAKDAAERELATQLSFQEALLETVPYPVFVKDTQGRYLEVNRAYEEAFGTARGDLLGRDLSQTRHVLGEEVDERHRSDLDVIRSGQPVEQELRVKMLGRPTPRNVLVWLHPFTNSAGQIAGLLGTLVDVTDIRDAEERARASEQRLKDTNEQLPGAVVSFRIHPDGTVTFDHVTGQAEHLFGGGDMTHLEGQPVQRVAVLQEDWPRLDATFRHVAQTHAPTTVEFRTLVNGNVRWVMLGESGTQLLQSMRTSIESATSDQVVATGVSPNSARKLLSAAGVPYVVAEGTDAEAAGADTASAKSGALLAATPEVAALDTRVTQTEADVSTMQSDVNGLSGRVTTTETSVADLNRRLDSSVSDSRAYADSRFDQAMGGIDMLRTEMNDRFDIQDKRIDGMGAMNSAMSTMSASLAGIHTQNRVGVGAGVTNGQKALSVGYQRAVSDRANFTLGASFTNDDHSVGAALGLGW